MLVNKFFDLVLDHVENDGNVKRGRSPELMEQLMLMMRIYENEVGRDEFYVKCKERIYKALYGNNIFKKYY